MNIMLKKTAYLLLMCLIAAPLWSDAADKDPNRTLDFTIGIVGLDEDSRSRFSEYRDIEDFQLTISELSLMNFGADNDVRYIVNMKNPGYEDMKLGLYSQYKDDFILETRYSAVPHYIEQGVDTQRDIYNTRLLLQPLSKTSASLSYYWEEKDGALSASRSVGQKADEIKAEISAGGSSLAAALSLTDSKMEHSYNGYDSDGVALSISSEINDVLFHSLLLDRKDVSSNRTSLLSKDLEITRAVYNARYALRDYFQVNFSSVSADSENKNTGKLGFEKKSYRIGCSLNTSYFRLGYNYRNSNTDYENADTDSKESDSHEIFFKGELGSNVKVRSSYTSEDRSSFGISAPSMTNFEQLASNISSGKINVVMTPTEKLTLSADYLSKEQKYEKVVTIGLDKQNFHSGILTYQYRYRPGLDFYGDYYLTKSLFNGTFQQVVAGANQYPSYRINQDNITYSLGLSLKISRRSDIDISYGQGSSKIGDYLRTNNISETNISALFTRNLKNDSDVTLSYERNNFHDRLGTAISGESNLVKLSFSKKTDF